MIQVKYTKAFGTFSEGDVRSYDDVSAERLVENGYAVKFDGDEAAPVEAPKPSTRRSAPTETVTVAEAP
jgi:hypothetical protein